jgi:hypothetical protein
MVETNNLSRSLLTRFKEFQALHLVRESEARKNRVRDLEGEVKRGKITIGNEQVQQYLASDFELARILVYLFRERQSQRRPSNVASQHSFRVGTTATACTEPRH